MDPMNPKKMWLRCEISPGQFSQERAVSGDTFDGEGFSLFAPLEWIRVDDASHDRSSGHIAVQILEVEGELALVRLPGHTLENGTTITVSMGELTKEPAYQKV
jgi:hypothetical protein